VLVDKSLAIVADLLLDARLIRYAPAMNTFDNSNKPNPTSKQSHDSDAPPNLVNFMLKSWKPKGAKALPKTRRVIETVSR
jgi:hypothetical protein